MSKIATMTIKVNPLAFRKFDSSEIGRGIGVHKVRKGRGSYTRKGKHKQRMY